MLKNILKYLHISFNFLFYNIHSISLNKKIEKKLLNYFVFQNNVVTLQMK